jgi:hypothetical protein
MIIIIPITTKASITITRLPERRRPRLIRTRSTSHPEEVMPPLHLLTPWPQRLEEEDTTALHHCTTKNFNTITITAPCARPRTSTSIMRISSG